MLLSDQSAKRIPSELWRAIFFHETAKLCARYNKGEWANKDEYERYINSIDLENYIYQLEQKAISEGKQCTDFPCNISLRGV